MVEYVADLDAIFGALADGTRRDILQLLQSGEMTVSDIAGQFDMSLAAVSKHLKVLEKVQLLAKERRGKQQYVQLQPTNLRAVHEFLRAYEPAIEPSMETIDELASMQRGSPNDIEYI